MRRCYTIISNLSSGGSDFYGIVEAAKMGLGMKGLMEDLGVEIGVHVNMGSSVPKRIVSRRGAACKTVWRRAR